MSKIVAHSDLDGLFSAILMCEITGLPPSSIYVAEPWEIRDNKVNLSNEDFVVDLPRPSVSVKFWADHHIGDEMKNLQCRDFAYDTSAKSAARVIFNKFRKSFPQIEKYFSELVWVDKVDSASYSLDEFINHNEYSILSMALKSSDKELDKYFFKVLVHEIMKNGSMRASFNPFVLARYQYKIDSQKRWRELIQPYMKNDCGVIVVDTRKITEKLPRGNSIQLFAEFQDAKSAIIISKNFIEERNVIHVGENPFFNRNNVNIGELMKKYGGGGHMGVGGCELPEKDTDRVVKDIVEALKNGKK